MCICANKQDLNKVLRLINLDDQTKWTRFQATVVQQMFFNFGGEIIYKPLKDISIILKIFFN